ncbi:hypothetical protein BURMUCF2_A2311 [Burkholderia multivorans CF2]|nr:hypothetical protein BURMUCF2_A2311 [Burkholderia multivorans CF2]
MLIARRDELRGSAFGEARQVVEQHFIWLHDFSGRRPSRTRRGRL